MIFIEAMMWLAIGSAVGTHVQIECIMPRSGLNLLHLKERELTVTSLASRSIQAILA
jgi:hypothetical protein